MNGQDARQLEMKALFYKSSTAALDKKYALTVFESRR
jgi:hypothetical protein